MPADASQPMPRTNDAVVNLSKRRGFVFPSSEIYGGSRSAWDYGPLGVELKENVRRQWWKAMVTGRDDIVGLDSAVILAPQVWEASGHVATFSDPLDRVPALPPPVPRRQARGRVRGTQGAAAAPLTEIPCPNCGTRGQWTEPKQFSSMLRTYLGPVEDESGLHYLRPETAQGIFVNFLNVLNTSRRKPPFGIAQTGKSFRNEITPGNFIFRTREFEQMEMEFFVEPGTDEQWHEYWLEQRWNWYVDLGIAADNLRFFEHPKEKLSHYSTRTVDIEYRFGFGGTEFAELEGIANRTDFDLKTHSEHSGVDLTYFDQASGERYTPYVIEPAAGLTRAVLAFLLDAYTEDEAPNAKGVLEKRTVLRLDKRLAPVKAAVLPLSRNDRAVAGRALARRRPAQALERRLRRRAGDRAALPPPGRDRHAVLRDRRLRHARRPGGHRPRAGLDDPGARRARPGGGLSGAAAAGLLIVMTALRVAPLRLSERVVADPPVVLAPMAGITNTAFRRLCRSYLPGGLYVSRDDHDACARRAQSQDVAADPLRAGRDAALDPALRRGPRDRRRGGADDRRRGPRRPRRPQLRLPGAEGDPPRRGIGVAVADRAVHATS